MPIPIVILLIFTGVILYACIGALIVTLEIAFFFDENRWKPGQDDKKSLIRGMAGMSRGKVDWGQFAGMLLFWPIITGIIVAVITIYAIGWVLFFVPAKAAKSIGKYTATIIAERAESS